LEFLKLKNPVPAPTLALKKLRGAAMPSRMASISLKIESRKAVESLPDSNV
jgi:hypothetical protein